MIESKEKFNKTYKIVKALENGLYQKYLDGDIVLQDIADEYGVSIQHIASIIKENNIGNPNKEKKFYRDEERKLIKRDIENGLPVDYFKPNYKLFENVSSPINAFNTISRWVKKDEFHTDIPYITLSRLNKIILSVNIRKYVESNNHLPKSKKESIREIAERFNVIYTKVANIASHIKKDTNHLLPQKDDELARIVLRNLNIVEEINYSKSSYEKSIIKASKKFNVDKDIIESILSCEAYVKGANLEEYIENRK